MLKLNLGGVDKFEGGSGSEKVEGYINVDARELPGVDYVVNFGEENLPFEDESVDEIRSSHVIEHIRPSNLKEVLLDWVRVLKKEGLIRIYCPNGELIFRHYVEGKISMGVANRFIFGNQDYEENLHRSAFDRKRLVNLLQEVGLEIVGEDPRPNAYKYDLGIQAKKVCLSQTKTKKERE